MKYSIKKTLLAFSLLAQIHNCLAIDVYNAATNQLTIPSVDVSGTIYNNVVLTVGSVVSIGSVTPPVSSPKYFALKAAMSDYVTNTSYGNYLIAGSGLNSDGSTFSVNGDMQSSKTASIVGIFESKNYLKTVQAQIGSMTFTNLKSGTAVMGSVTYPYSSQSNDYWDASFNPMGHSSSSTFVGKTTNHYKVNQIVTTIPDFVKVGDTGTLNTSTDYSDSSKSTALATSTTSYRVKNDSENTVLIDIVTNDKNTNGSTSTEIETYKLDSNGVIFLYSVTTTSSNGLTMIVTKR
jgi:hypothetical protein